MTHTHVVPTMFHRLLALPEEVRASAEVSTLRHVLHGAAPCPVTVKRAAIEWLGPIIWEYYAATEGVGSFVGSEAWLERPGTVGRPFGADQVYVGDEEGVPLGPGETGLVYLKATGVARFDYFKDAEKTAAAFRGDYFTLGDVGYLDEDGYLFLTDRTANLIISGGVNIYPAEVDAVLLEHPAVGDAAVIGIPDDEWGESVHAVVELRDGLAPSDALAEELIEHCRAPARALQVPAHGRVRGPPAPRRTTARSTSAAFVRPAAAVAAEPTSASWRREGFRPCPPPDHGRDGGTTRRSCRDQAKDSRMIR